MSPPEAQAASFHRPLLDQPGHCLKLPDGPRVEPRRLSEHRLRYMDIDDSISKFVIVNVSICNCVGVVVE